jgi:hypothetical protein
MAENKIYLHNNTADTGRELSVPLMRIKVFFCRCWISSTICWRDYLFSNAYFGLVCGKSDCCSCVDLCQGLLFCSIGLHVCFCAGTMLCFLLWLCSIVWGQVLWHLQHRSFGSGLFGLFKVFWTSKWTLRLTFLSRWIMSLEFWYRLHWTQNAFSSVAISQYWFCQSVSMGCPSISCYLHWFLSLVTCKKKN